MTTRDFFAFLLFTLGLAFLTWSVLRARRWEKYQQQAVGRGKLIAGEISKGEVRYEQAIEISREHLQVSRELLVEIKSLREDLKGK